MKQHYKEDLVNDFMTVIKKRLRYKNPKLINFDKLDDLYNTYVLPIFLQPGKTHFFIRNAYDSSANQQYKFGLRKLLPYQEVADVGYRWYYNTHICEVREEEIPLYSKTLKMSNVSRAFSKENSVFAPWIEDNS